LQFPQREISLQLSLLRQILRGIRCAVYMIVENEVRKVRYIVYKDFTAPGLLSLGDFGQNKIK
jgi:hypothetical protein